MESRSGFAKHIAAAMFICSPASLIAQAELAPSVEKARAFAVDGVTDIATFYVPADGLGLLGRNDEASRRKVETMLKNGSIEQVYHATSRAAKGELGRKGNFPKLGSMNQNGSFNPAPDGGTEMPLGFVVTWDRSPVSIEYNVIHGEMGKKSRLGKTMVPTYARGSVIGGQVIVFDRPVYSMVGLPEGSKHRNKMAVAVISPAAISALDALTTGEQASGMSTRR